jgi:3-methyladenine DNA glycosylase AlkD
VQRYFKHAVVALGIDTPTLRTYVREQVTRLRPVWTANHAVECCARLLQEPELELRGAGLLLLAGFERQLTAEFVSHAESWLQSRLDNWALVDSLCGLVLSPLLDREPAIEQALRRWSRADSLWVRRAALVTLVPSARRGRRLDLAYELAAAHFPDPEDLIHKATGWLLREAGKTDADRLRRFLLRHGPAVPRTTLRYAIERFPAAERARLLRTTRETAGNVRDN